MMDLKILKTFTVFIVCILYSEKNSEAAKPDNTYIYDSNAKFLPILNATDDTENYFDTYSLAATVNDLRSAKNYVSEHEIDIHSVPPNTNILEISTFDVGNISGNNEIAINKLYSDRSASFNSSVAERIVEQPASPLFPNFTLIQSVDEDDNLDKTIRSREITVNEKSHLVRLMSSEESEQEDTDISDSKFNVGTQYSISNFKIPTLSSLPFETMRNLETDSKTFLNPLTRRTNESETVRVQGNKFVVNQYISPLTAVLKAPADTYWSHPKNFSSYSPNKKSSVQTVDRSTVSYETPSDRFQKIVSALAEINPAMYFGIKMALYPQYYDDDYFNILSSDNYYDYSVYDRDLPEENDKDFHVSHSVRTNSLGEENVQPYLNKYGDGKYIQEQISDPSSRETNVGSNSAMEETLEFTVPTLTHNFSDFFYVSKLTGDKTRSGSFLTEFAHAFPITQSALNSSVKIGRISPLYAEVNGTTMSDEKLLSTNHSTQPYEITSKQHNFNLFDDPEIITDPANSSSSNFDKSAVQKIFVEELPLSERLISPQRSYAKPKLYANDVNYDLHKTINPDDSVFEGATEQYPVFNDHSLANDSAPDYEYYDDYYDDKDNTPKSVSRMLPIDEHVQNNDSPTISSASANYDYDIDQSTSSTSAITKESFHFPPIDISDANEVFRDPNDNIFPIDLSNIIPTVPFQNNKIPHIPTPTQSSSYSFYNFASIIDDLASTVSDLNASALLTPVTAGPGISYSDAREHDNSAYLQPTPADEIKTSPTKNFKTRATSFPSTFTTVQPRQSSVSSTMHVDALRGPLHSDLSTSKPLRLLPEHVTTHFPMFGVSNSHRENPFYNNEHLQIPFPDSTTIYSQFKKVQGSTHRPIFATSPLIFDPNIVRPRNISTSNSINVLEHNDLDGTDLVSSHVFQDDFREQYETSESKLRHHIPDERAKNLLHSQNNLHFAKYPSRSSTVMTITPPGGFQRTPPSIGSNNYGRGYHHTLHDVNPLYYRIAEKSPTPFYPSSVGNYPTFQKMLDPFSGGANNNYYIRPLSSSIENTAQVSKEQIRKIPTFVPGGHQSVVQPLSPGSGIGSTALLNSNQQILPSWSHLPVAHQFNFPPDAYHKLPYPPLLANYQPIRFFPLNQFKNENYNPLNSDRFSKEIQLPFSVPYQYSPLSVQYIPVIAPPYSFGEVDGLFSSGNDYNIPKEIFTSHLSNSTIEALPVRRLKEIILDENGRIVKETFYEGNIFSDNSTEVNFSQTESDNVNLENNITTKALFNALEETIVSDFNTTEPILESIESLNVEPASSSLWMPATQETNSLKESSASKIEHFNSFEEEPISEQLNTSILAGTNFIEDLIAVTPIGVDGKLKQTTSATKTKVDLNNIAKLIRPVDKPIHNEISMFTTLREALRGILRHPTYFLLPNEKSRNVSRGQNDHAPQILLDKNVHKLPRSENLNRKDFLLVLSEAEIGALPKTGHYRIIIPYNSTIDNGHNLTSETKRLSPQTVLTITKELEAFTSDNLINSLNQTIDDTFDGIHLVGANGTLMREEANLTETVDVDNSDIMAISKVIKFLESSIGRIAEDSQKLLQVRFGTDGVIHLDTPIYIWRSGSNNGFGMRLLDNMNFIIPTIINGSEITASSNDKITHGQQLKREISSDRPVSQQGIQNDAKIANETNNEEFYSYEHGINYDYNIASEDKPDENLAKSDENQSQFMHNRNREDISELVKEISLINANLITTLNPLKISTLNYIVPSISDNFVAELQKLFLYPETNKTFEKRTHLQENFSARPKLLTGGQAVGLDGSNHLVGSLNPNIDNIDQFLKSSNKSAYFFSSPELLNEIRMGKITNVSRSNLAALNSRELIDVKVEEKSNHVNIVPLPEIQEWSAGYQNENKNNVEKFIVNGVEVLQPQEQILLVDDTSDHFDISKDVQFVPEKPVNPVFVFSSSDISHFPSTNEQIFTQNAFPINGNFQNSQVSLETISNSDLIKASHSLNSIPSSSEGIIRTVRTVNPFVNSAKNVEISLAKPSIDSPSQFPFIPKVSFLNVFDEKAIPYTENIIENGNEKATFLQESTDSGLHIVDSHILSNPVKMFNPLAIIKKVDDFTNFTPVSGPFIKDTVFRPSNLTLEQIHQLIGDSIASVKREANIPLQSLEESPLEKNSLESIPNTVILAQHVQPQGISNRNIDVYHLPNVGTHTAVTPQAVSTASVRNEKIGWRWYGSNRKLSGGETLQDNETHPAPNNWMAPSNIAQSFHQTDPNLIAGSQMRLPLNNETPPNNSKLLKLSNVPPGHERRGITNHYRNLPTRSHREFVNNNLHYIDMPNNNNYNNNDNNNNKWNVQFTSDRKIDNQRPFLLKNKILGVIPITRRQRFSPPLVDNHFDGFVPISPIRSVPR